MPRKLTTKAITDDAITADKIVAGAVVADIGAATVTPTHLHNTLDLSSKTVTLPTLADLTVDTDTLVVDSSNNRVGIGTTSPQMRLEVREDVAGETGAFVVNPNAGGYAALRLGNSDRSTNGDHLIYGGGQFGIRSKTGADITLEPASQVVARVKSTGRVGINQDTPISALHVKGNAEHAHLTLQAGGSAGNQNQTGIKFQKDDGTQIGLIGVEEGATNSGQMVFYTGVNGVEEAFRITTDGKIIYTKDFNNLCTDFTTSNGGTSYGTYRLFRFGMSMTGNVSYNIDFVGFSAGMHKVMCQASHWTGGYMTFRESFLGFDSYTGITEQNIHSLTSSSQGSFSFSRPGANGSFRIHKSAGSYIGGMAANITIITPSNPSISSIS